MDQGKLILSQEGVEAEFEEAESKWRIRLPFHGEAGGVDVVVPAGFLFDLATIPRPLRPFVLPTAFGLRAPLLHDYLYNTRGLKGRITRLQADRAFRRDIREYRGKGALSWAAWIVVRSFGWAWWMEGK